MTKREAKQIADDFKAIQNVEDSHLRRRKFRKLMAEAGHRLMGDSAWRSVGTDNGIYHVNTLPFDDCTGSPSAKPLREDEILTFMKERQDAFELEVHKFSNLRSPTDFIAANHFLEFIVKETRARPLAKWGLQIPDLKRWCLTKDDGTTIELLSDVHPGTETQFDDNIGILSQAASEVIGRFETQALRKVQEFVANKEERLKATLQHIDEKLAAAPNDAQRAEFESSRHVAACQLSEIEQERLKETEERLKQQRVRSDSSLLLAAAIPLENLLWTQLHSHSILLPPKVHHALSRIVHDPEGELQRMSPEEASKAITAIRLLRSNKEVGPLPVSLPEFRALLEASKPWFVVEHVESDFMLYQYTMAALVKARQGFSLESGVRWVLDARTRALIKSCLESTSLPEDARGLLREIYTKAEPSSLSQVNEAIRRIDIAAQLVTTCPTTLIRPIVLMIKEAERISLPHAAATELPHPVHALEVNAKELKKKAAICPNEDPPSGSQVRELEEIWSPPMPQVEIARRIMDRDNARFRDVEGIVERHGGLKKIRHKAYQIQVDKMDSEMRERIMRTN